MIQETSTQEMIQVDAFTDRRFSGNPAAVCVMDRPADVTWMQAVAAEMNLSETAFLYPEGSHYNLRWFTPVCEVNLCGHATLASAHVLYESERAVKDQPILFSSRSGELSATLVGGRIELDFPATALSKLQSAPDGLALALGGEISSVYGAGEDLLVEAPSAESVRKLRPNFSALAEVDVRGVVVTARSDDSEYDIISRFFAPRFGVPEDSVTGSAHCALGPHWAAKLSKDVIRAYQASARGGSVHVTVRGSRVGLAGHAVTVLRGSLV